MLKGPTYQGRLFLNALCAQLLGHVQLSVASWTIARQDPLSVGFFRQENWAGSPFPTPAALPNPGIKPTSPVSPALAGIFSTTAPPRKPQYVYLMNEPKRTGSKLIDLKDEVDKFIVTVRDSDSPFLVLYITGEQIIEKYKEDLNK